MGATIAQITRAWVSAFLSGSSVSVVALTAISGYER
jgi:hypothetical protein